MKVGLLMSLGGGGGSVPPSMSGGTASLVVCRNHSLTCDSDSAFRAKRSRLVSRCKRSFRFLSSSRKFSSRLSPDACLSRGGGWDDALILLCRGLALVWAGLEGVVLVGMPDCRELPSLLESEGPKRKSMDKYSKACPVTTCV